MKRLLSTPIILLLMALTLLLFQVGGTLPTALVSVALFGLLALLRPDLALLFVPLTAPLYLIPAQITGLRADPSNPFRLPTYEVALLLTFGATLARWGWRVLLERRFALPDWPTLRQQLKHYAPHLLFLLAGLLGVALAVEQGRALREFRWLILEPLMLYGLVKFQLATAPTPPTDNAFRFSGFRAYLLNALVIGGALTGALGLLQFVGVDLVPLLGRKECFAPDGSPCANIVADGSVRRVLSVYGHPNNLGLALGRVWPLGASLTLALVLRHYGRNTQQRGLLILYALGTLCALGGILVSFSRGAWLGAAAALVVLVLLASRLLSANGPKRGGIFQWGVAAIAVLVVAAGLVLNVRGDITGGSTPVRLLLWQEATQYLQRHPLGIGLDQFGFYHDPQNTALTLINPALIGTSEQYASHPHTMLLDILLRIGPLGLLAFVWLIVRCVRHSVRLAHTRTAWPLGMGVLAAMVAALVHGQVDHFYFVPDLAVLFWILIALGEESA